MNQSTIDSAYEIVQEASVPDDFKLIAFQIVLERMLSSQPEVTSSSRSESNSGQSMEDWVVQLASALKVSFDSIQFIYETDEKEGLILRAESLPAFDTLTEATKHISILLLAGRQGTRQEISTKQADVRAVVDHLRALDSANFSTTITSLKDYLLITGQGAKKSLKLKPAGYKLAAKIIQEMA